MRRRDLAGFAARVLMTTAAVLALCASGALAQAIGPFQPVSGVVINSAGQPVPGCRVQLQNQQVGPSPVVLTNGQGFYFFPQVPVQVQSAYIVQVYWGPQLVYQAYLTRLGQQPPIQLR